MRRREGRRVAHVEGMKEAHRPLQARRRPLSERGPWRSSVWTGACQWTSSHILSAPSPACGVWLGTTCRRAETHGEHGRPCMRAESAKGDAPVTRHRREGAVPRYKAGRSRAANGGPRSQAPSPGGWRRAVMVRMLGLLPHQLAECVAGRVCVGGGVARADQSSLIHTRAPTAVGGRVGLVKSAVQSGRCSS